MDAPQQRKRPHDDASTADPVMTEEATSVLLSRMHEVCSSAGPLSELLLSVNSYRSLACSIGNNHTMKNHQRKKMKTHHGDNIITSSPYADMHDGKTPLHRLCAPPSPLRETEPDLFSDLSDSDDFYYPFVIEEARPSVRSILPRNHYVSVLECVRVLIEDLSPSMTSVQDRHGETALHLLARHSPHDSYEDMRLEILRTLLKTSQLSDVASCSSSLVLMQDKEGNTALHTSLRRQRALLFPQAEDFDRTLMKANPFLLQLENKQGQTPLHIVCRYQSTSIETITYMTNIYPEALCRQDAHGFTPLHYVCEHVQSETLSALLEIASSSSLSKQALLLQNHRGFTPLHLACMDRAPLSVLVALMDKCSSAARIVDQDGCTALHRLLSAHTHTFSRLKAFVRGNNNNDDNDDNNDGDSTTQLDGTNAEVWAKVLCLLSSSSSLSDNPQKRSSSSSSRGGDTTQIVHRAIKAGAPDIVLQIAMKLYPYQMEEPTPEGDLPLHMYAKAASSSSSSSSLSHEEVRSSGLKTIFERRKHIITTAWRDFSAVATRRHNMVVGDQSDLSDDDDDEDDEDDDDDDDDDNEESRFHNKKSTYLSEHYSDQSCITTSSSSSSSEESTCISSSTTSHNNSTTIGSSSTCDIILSSYEQGARIRGSQERLPLHMALASGKTWTQGVCSLVSAFPDSLMIRDPVTKLHPFALAAAANNNNNNNNNNVVQGQQTLDERQRHEEEEATTTTTTHEEESSSLDQKSQTPLRQLNNIFILLSCNPKLVVG